MNRGGKTMAKETDIKSTWNFELKSRKKKLANLSKTNEPRHDKTNKVTVRPAETDQTGHAQSDQSLRCALNG